MKNWLAALGMLFLAGPAHALPPSPFIWRGTDAVLLPPGGMINLRGEYMTANRGALAIAFSDFLISPRSTTAAEAGEFSGACSNGTIVGLGSAAGHPGIWQMSTTTNAAGRCSINTNVLAVIAGSGELESRSRFRFATLPTAAETFTLAVGFGDNTNADFTDSAGYISVESASTFTCTGDTVDTTTGIADLKGCVGVTGVSSIQVGQTVTGAGIPASTTVASVSGTTLVLSQAATATAGDVTLTFTYGDFFAINQANSGTFSRIITSVVPVVATWYQSRVVVNAAGTNTDFYYSTTPGTWVSLGSLTAQIPTAAGREFGAWTGIRKTNGTTARTMDVDTMYFHMKMTTER